MSVVKKSVGFRTKGEVTEPEFEEWDIYPTHLIIPEGYWCTSSNILVENKEQ